jgi:transposase
MTTQTNPTPIEVETYQIGVASIVLNLLKRLGIAEIIDSFFKHQPEIGASYGTLALVVIINRLSFDPQPLYALCEWAERHGIDRLLGIDAAWLDDDRVGALMEGLAKHATEIWLRVIVRAVKHFGIVLEWLHADTTSVYFEGRYEDEHGQPLDEKNAPKLVAGYNKDGKPKNVQMVLSLITHKRVPLWYKPWNGNQSDDEVYLADLKGLRQAGLSMGNVVLVFDRKGCNQETMQDLCHTRQGFVGAHPWTDTAKSEWEKTLKELETGQRSWQEVAYVSRNNQRKPVEERPQYRVCEIAHELKDAARQTSYTLRWVFSWNSSKAELDARQRQKQLADGEAALQRVAGLLGKYDYTSRTVILSRLGKGLVKAKASAYFQYSLSGSDDKQDWQLTWSQNRKTIAQSERFDGVVLLCTNLPVERLSSGGVVEKYKEQVQPEQAFDFIKSPIQIRPMWLHSPQRIAGLTLLIMLAVLLASLIEHRVRQEIATNKKLIKGLMPDNRDNPYPTAEKLLKAFQDYTVVILRYPDGREEILYPKLRPVQQHILGLLGILSIHLNPV